MDQRDQGSIDEAFLPAPRHWEKIKAMYQAQEEDSDQASSPRWTYAYRCCYAAHALYLHFPQFFRINLVTDMWMIVVAMYDLGRRGPEAEASVEESQKRCKSFLIQELYLSKTAATKLTDCMGNETPASFKNLQCLLQDAHALVQSSLLGNLEVDLHQLHLIKGLGPRYLSHVQKILKLLQALPEKVGG